MEVGVIPTPPLCRSTGVPAATISLLSSFELRQGELRGELLPQLSPGVRVCAVMENENATRAVARPKAARIRT